MSGLVLLAAILAIAAIVVWSLLNDNVEMRQKTRWLLAMRDDFEAEESGPDPDATASEIAAAFEAPGRQPILTVRRPDAAQGPGPGRESAPPDAKPRNPP